MSSTGALSACASNSTVSPALSRRTSSSQTSSLILTRRDSMSLRTCVQLWPGSQRRSAAASVLPAWSARTGKDCFFTKLMAVLFEFQLAPQAFNLRSEIHFLLLGLIGTLLFLFGPLLLLLE